MSNTMVFPQLSGYNWPSNVLHAWLALHHAGVPDRNIRFLPYIGHFAAPETTLEDADAAPYYDAEDLAQYPSEPRYDGNAGQVTVDVMDPSLVHPRLMVNVRADTAYDFNAPVEEGPQEISARMVGRLAHFALPLLAGLDIEAPHEQDKDMHRPLERLLHQICARYPELLQCIPAQARNVLERLANSLQRMLMQDDSSMTLADINVILDTMRPGKEEEAKYSTQTRTGQKLQESRFMSAESGYRMAFLEIAEKITVPPEQGHETQSWGEAIVLFSQWPDLLFSSSSATRVNDLKKFLEGLNTGQRQQQGLLMSQFSALLTFETLSARSSAVRELLEIMTTEAFSAVAAIDGAWGLGFVHGPLSDHRQNEGAFRYDGLLLSMTGGMGHRTLLQTLMERWADQSAFLGIRCSERGDTASERVPSLDGTVLSSAERQEVWSLAALRREAADPLALFQLAARRLLHPKLTVHVRQFINTPCRFGTLFAQLQQSDGQGGTATLGSTGMFYCPNVVISIPFTENPADAENGSAVTRTKSILNILRRIFLPICAPVEIVWQQGIARLDQSSYLQHDFQQGVQLASL